MVLAKLKYIKAYTDRHGIKRYYFRQRGKPEMALPGEPLCAEFMAAYHAARGVEKPIPKSTGKTLPGSVKHALTEWYKSAKFKSLEAGTQANYKGLMERELKDEMDKPIRLLQANHVEDWMDDRAERPGAAKSFLKRLKTFLKFTTKRGFTVINAAQYVEPPQYETEGFIPWTEDDATNYEKKWPIGTKQHLAYALMVYTSQRVSDASKMGPQHVEEGRIRVTQAKLRKNKKRVTVLVPMHPKLVTAIKAVKATGHLVYLVTNYGKAYSIKGLSQDFSRWAQEAGLDEGKTAHGLRKLAGARLAEAGCSEKEIMAILGLSSIKEAATYTASAAQKVLADAGMKKQIEAENRVDNLSETPIESNEP